MNKKHLPIILFVSIGFLSIGLGSFKASNEMVKEAKADGGFKIDYNGASITLGMYPNMIVYESEWAALEEGKTDLGNNKYEYNRDYYSKILARPSGGGEVLPGNIYSSQIWNIECWFKWEPIEWQTVKEDTANNITYFYSKYILDTARWQSGSHEPANDWEYSTIRQFLNNEFYNRAFTDEEKQAVFEFTTKEDNTSNVELKDFVGLITKKELNKHEKFLNCHGTGYAMARSLRYYKDYNDNNEAYYYLNSIDNTTLTNEVDCAHAKKTDSSITTNDTRVDSEIGVRPLIAIDNNYLVRKTTGGGGGGGYVNVPLIIAIIFSVLGMAGVITFLTLWHKGKLFKVGSTKAPIWVIASISVSLVISIVGTCMIFANTGGQGSGYSISSPVGYWGGTYFTLDDSSPDFGNSYYLGLTKDFKVYRYISNYWDEDGGTVSNPLIKPVYGVGSWSIRNKKLIITAAPEWDLFYFEEPVTEYYATNGFGFARHGRIMNYGDQKQQSYEVQGYRWTHASNYNPTGEAVKLRDIHYYDF